MASRARRHELKNAVPPTISRKLFDGGIVEVAPVALEDELLLMHGDSFWIILVQQLGQQEINAVTGQCALGARCGVPSSLPLCRIFPPATQSICCIPMTPSAKVMANSGLSQTSRTVRDDSANGLSRGVCKHACSCRRWSDRNY